jgi:hypothetical protein
MHIQDDSVVRGPKILSINAFKCAWMWKETIFGIDYKQVLFFIVPGMCI